MDTSKQELSGIPPPKDRGLLRINFIAEDGLGNQAVEPMSIYVGDVNITSIPQQQVYTGNSTLFTFASETFEYPQANFTYSVALANGTPLPSFIGFDSDSRTFVFAPRSGDQNTYPIEVTAHDGYGGSWSTDFTLTIPDRPPVCEQPIQNQTAYSGESFNYVFSEDSFTDLDMDTLTYSANEKGNPKLPAWLKFDPALRQFSGTPFGKNSYTIEIIANDRHGKIVTNLFTLTVPPSAPIVLNPPNNQIASLNMPFSYTIPLDTFYDIDNDQLSYTTDQLPSFLFFNPSTRTFSGTPQLDDSGAYLITIYAVDTLGESVSTTFNLNVVSTSQNNPPVVLKEIPNESVQTGIPFTYTFDANTFQDPEGDALTYAAFMEGGAALIPGLYFDSDTRTLSGELLLPQIVRISIHAIDPNGSYVVETFTLNVVDTVNLPPLVLNPLPNLIATVGQKFYFQIPDDTFIDLNGDELKISTNQAGGNHLPQWLKWDEAKHALYGTPGYWDTGTYQDKSVNIEVWATDGVGSVKAGFQLSVQGESFWEIFINVGIGVSSIATSALGVYRSRAIIWNYFNAQKNKKALQTVIIGEEYVHKIPLEYNQVREVRSYYNGKPLAKLPDGLHYDGSEIKGKPKANSQGLFTIRVFDKHGYIIEEYDLSIKKEADDSNLEKENANCRL